jgi:hypothetical protein
LLDQNSFQHIDPLQEEKREGDEEDKGPQHEPVDFFA